MLPAPKSDGLSLADVLASCLESLGGHTNRLGLAPAGNAVVLLVDGLGADQLKARAGHSRVLAPALSPRAVIEAGFPSTTASSLASLTTGTLPGVHGLVGYSVLDPAHDRVVNQLHGWDKQLDPATWQRVPTLFERAAAQGLDPVVVGAPRYRDSGFTNAVLRGARFVGAESIQDRMDAAAAVLRTPGPPKLMYVYVPELDMALHAHGTESAEWTDTLEQIDAAAKTLVSALGKRDGMLVTADHGAVDVAAHNHVEFDDLMDGVRHAAGEPRAVQLHLEPDAVREVVVGRWRAAEGHRAWIATRDEAVSSGWFGDVHPDVLPRIGDIIVAARKAVAYYHSEWGGRNMVGQHGSLSPAELRVPLLRFGAFAP